jgi:hypothetical protein
VDDRRLLDDHVERNVDGVASRCWCSGALPPEQSWCDTSNCGVGDCRQCDYQCALESLGRITEQASSRERFRRIRWNYHGTSTTTPAATDRHECSACCFIQCELQQNIMHLHLDVDG